MDVRRRSDQHTYSPDPSMAETPVTSDELERLTAAVAAGGGGLTSKRAIEHLLRRVEVTIDANHDQIRRLHQEISRVHLENNRSLGTATTLHPADSFRYLSADEQRAVVDGHLREKLDAVAAEERKVRDERAALVRAASQLRWAVDQLMRDPSVPAAVQGRLVELLTLAEQTGADLTGSGPSVAGPALGAAPAPTRTPAPPAPAQDDDLASLLGDETTDPPATQGPEPR